MEKVRQLDPHFWEDKKVLVTGHTGFKGSWLCLWLSYWGAEVTGYALRPPTQPSLFQLAGVGSMITSIHGDIRDGNKLKDALLDTDPDIIIHMAAQPLVRESYVSPLKTYETNVLGTVHLFEAVRQAVKLGKRVRAVINVTTDKCYENKEWAWGYRENDRLGGYDPYSNSKACSELVTASYRNSFFSARDYPSHGIALATARAGNVIGGGDWATDRLVPDCIRALLKSEKIKVRNPGAIRPWQHVLEPLSGYLMLAQKLYEHGPEYAKGWNFGPDDSDAKPVGWIVEQICNKWGRGASFELDRSIQPHEAHYLKLDSSRARMELGWRPRWTVEEALERVIEWARAYQENRDLTAVCLDQLEVYLRS
ncbi:CDP-glucose 4,6-dehydratase [Polycladomyces sp. WAk]|uniref:CDP-glucose 4,6-dehydratase n=1 Tax=Polycladomyces zharkentensis TaxID=2807616 RepID=A0ABS2WJ41_9BACL|nr:CDP-glucose 4,6-dehydratase [Polycladomyces sp. WAk]MBN2909549.1 CDP-glucose 4,6-dehydratase [Polycladomyces sp. WAk]